MTGAGGATMAAGGDGPGGAGGTGATGGAGGLEIPYIDEVLGDDCGGSGPSAGAPVGEELYRLSLDDYPDALCNDGSPGVVFIRRAATTENEGRWVFFFQGGAGCWSYDDCYNRWCGKKAPYHAGKMSSQFTAVNIKGNGIFSRDASHGNNFADSNQVYLYYCSSDSWGGRSETVFHDEGGDRPSFRVHYRGRQIVEAVFDKLLSGATSSEMADESLPPLADATDVLITGSSAGAGGVTQNIDWIVSQLTPNGTDVKAVFDATFYPDRSEITNTELVDVLVDLDATSYAARIEHANYHFDQSCVAAHAADPELCYSNTHVRLNHITVPFLQYIDLKDSAVVGFLTGTGLGATEDDVAAWQRATMLKLADVPTDAEEAASIDTQPGAASLNCGKHVVLDDNAWFFNATIDDTGGTPRSIYNAVDLWVGGTDVQLIDELPPASTSVCP